MKIVRYFAALLLLITGIMHLIPIFKTPEDPNAIPMVLFAVAFLATCILLYLDKKIAPIAGIVFTLAGLAIGFFVIGVKSWTTMLAIMFIIDAVVLTCCIFLLMNRGKGKITT